jgi:hypothetical protein
MKTLKLFLGAVFLGIVLIACEKDSFTTTPDEPIDTRAPEEVVIPFKGKFISTPTSYDEWTDCGYGVMLTINNAVSGNATHLGELDMAQSPLYGVDCSFDPATGIVTATLDMTFMNYAGDGLRILGQSDMSVNGPASGSYTVMEGFGKLAGATGDLNTKGQLDPATITAEFEVYGKITVPK